MPRIGPQCHGRGGEYKTLQGLKCPSFLDVPTLGDKVTTLAQNVRI